MKAAAGGNPQQPSMECQPRLNFGQEEDKKNRLESVKVAVVMASEANQCDEKNI